MMGSGGTQVHDGSGQYSTRLPRAVRSSASTTVTGPNAPVPARPTPSTSSSQGPRRKRTTDQAFSTDRDFENAQHKRILRPRTAAGNNTTKPERPPRLRPVKATAAKATTTTTTATVVGNERDRIPLSVISSAGAPWKQAITRIPILSNSNVINRLRKSSADAKFPGPLAISTSSVPTPTHSPPPTPTLESAPLPLAFPANILNADLFDGHPEPLTEYLSFDALDDLARWDIDMASLPSIPSPPTSPNYRNKCKSNTFSSLPNPGTISIPSPAPFSSHIDDDVLLETDKDFPFPFVHRNSKVVRENMGVKKPRTLARTRSSQSLQFGGVGVDSLSLSPFQQTLAGLPNPLPQITLPKGTTTPNPLLSKSTTTPVSAPRRAAGGATTWRDSNNNIHLGAIDCELSLAFPDTSHFEFWDADDDDDILPCPMLLCLFAKDSYPWLGKALALPDVTLFDIRVEDIQGPARRVPLNPADQFVTHYTGTRVQPSPPPVGAGRLTFFDPKVVQGGTPEVPPGAEEGQGYGAGRVRISPDDITVEPKWIRTYARPGVSAPSSSRSSPSSSSPPGTTTPFGSPDHRKSPIGGDTSVPRSLRRATASTTSSSSSNSVRGWYLKFWVPIPARLFAKRETRVFRIHARVWMNGDEERALRLDSSPPSGIGAIPSGMVGPDVGGGGHTGGGAIFPLVAETRMTVSHLRSRREMDGWC